ncbi:hypothetical protein [Hydrogenophaga flava]|uniref:hypothetical protein n=1 Tax=Hydrogenophaga flava TaxID=65657 RepID=UPI0008260DE0|nr:hypothetical protein [Hydrogenophaga flava]
MSPLELALLMGWVLLPPWVLATAVLAALHVSSGTSSLARTGAAVLILLSVSASLALLLLMAGPSGWGSRMGLRDEPVLWAPFAFISVACALPLAIWWLRRRVPR